MEKNNNLTNERNVNGNKSFRRRMLDNVFDYIETVNSAHAILGEVIFRGCSSKIQRGERLCSCSSSCQACSKPGNGSAPELPPDLLQQWKQELLCCINKTREESGLAPVRLSKTLSQVAKLHNEDQAAMGKVSHIGSDGSLLGDRIKRQGYEIDIGSENVAAGQKDPVHLHRSFLRSTERAVQVMKLDVDEVGIHVGFGYDGRLYWTEVFGRKKCQL